MANKLRQDTKAVSEWDRRRHSRDVKERASAIFVGREPLPSDGAWYGAAPRPAKKEEKAWRPKDILL